MLLIFSDAVRLTVGNGFIAIYVINVIKTDLASSLQGEVSAIAGWFVALGFLELSALRYFEQKLKRIINTPMLPVNGIKVRF